MFRRFFCRTGFHLFAVTLYFGLTMPPAMAQANQIKVLEEKLKQRDRVVLELLQRVEALEKRLGGRAQQQNKSTDPSTTPQKQTSTPGKITVNAATAERALERSLAREGALLLSKGYLEVEPRFTFARREDRSVAGGSAVELNANRLSAQLDMRLGLPWDAQLEVGLPYRLSHVEGGSNTAFANASSATSTGTGFGDLRIGIAKTLLREDVWRPDLIGRITWDTNTGPRTDNSVSLGGGFHEIEASLTAIKRQDPMVFIGRLAHTYGFREGNITPGGLTTLDLGTTFALSPETSMRFFLTTGYQDETEVGGNPLVGSDQVIGQFTIGTSTLLAPGVLANFSLGVGLTDDTDDFTLSFSIPIRFDGPIY